MAAVGIIPGLVIGLREGIEAALIVGLIAGYLSKTDRGSLNRYVIVGGILAVFASIAAAGLLVALSIGFEGTAEQLFEGITAIAAVAVLTFMIFWMMKASVEIRRHFQDRIDNVAGRGEVFGLIGFAFVAVFREGLETALFMLGAASATTTTDAVAGVALGIGIAVLLALALPRLYIRVSLKRFFQVTSVILILFAAGLFARGVHELQEASVIQAGSAPVYDLSGVFSSGENNPIGYLLRGILGYSDSPSQLEVAVYFGFLALCAFLFLFAVLRQRGVKTDDEEDAAVSEGDGTSTATIDVGAEVAEKLSSFVKTNVKTVKQEI